MPTKKTTKKETSKTITILCHNAAGKYKLPYAKGAKVSLDAKLAEEMIDNGDAK